MIHKRCVFDSFWVIYHKKEKLKQAPLIKKIPPLIYENSSLNAENSSPYSENYSLNGVITN
jgi:hypothetical protein